jgi:hypothetical protein
MSVRAVLLAGLLLLAPALSHAQATGEPASAAPAGTPITSLRGKFQDPLTQAAVPGVQVKLTSMADTSDVHRATAKDDGTFEITGLGVHSYRLEATRLGYAPLRTILRVTKKDQDAGVLALTAESVPVPGITVTESPAPAVQKADTTEYRASAVKTQKDATAEELVQKLPGVTMENGQVRAQGEPVRQVLVNGRPFFGSDPTAAMRNLPADVVDRIQVYDRGSDQAEFSGFDDGQSQRTMNFILRDQRAKFGRLYAGGGDQDRYQAGGNASFIHGATRVTLIGMSNNINQRNFSPQDLFGALGGGGGGPRIQLFGGGGGGRGGGGGQVFRFGGGGGGGAFDPASFLVNQQQGISTTHSGGVNYAAQFGKKVALTASAFVNYTDTRNLQTLTREYLPPQDSTAFYDQNSITGGRSGNQRVDARLEWTIDSLNSVIFQPRLYFQNTRSTNDADAANTSELDNLLSASRGTATDDNHGNNLSNRLTVRHRFAKRGRNVSADLNYGHNQRDGDGSQQSFTDYYLGTAASDTVDQQTTAHTETDLYSARLAYTEPISKSLQAQAIYNPSATRSTSDGRGYAFDPITGSYAVPESALSNSYLSHNTIQLGGLAVLYTHGAWKLLSNLSYQRQGLRSEQTFPGNDLIDRDFNDLIPSMTLTGSFANRRNLRVAWNTSTTAPNISQLQNVVNNTNPLSLSTGNPALQPAYNHSISLRLSEADPSRSRSKFLFMNVSRTSDPIANSTFTAPFDTTVGGIFLGRGTQLTRPKNLSESWNGNLFGVWSRPLSKIKSILSLNGGLTYTRTPTEINTATNIASTYAIRPGVVLSSNISQNLDFTVSYWCTYTIANNTLTTSSSGDYFTHSAGLRLNQVVGPGIVLRQEVNHNLQTGVPSAYGQDVLLWNLTIGKKMLKEDRGELKVTTSDVLRQNRSVSRSVTESYVQDSRDQALGRYVQVVFTYSFRSGLPAPGAGGGMPVFRP